MPSLVSCMSLKEVTTGLEKDTLSIFMQTIPSIFRSTFGLTFEKIIYQYRPPSR